MKFHDAKLKKLQEYSELHQRLDVTDSKDAQMLLELSLHAVDIGHPTYSWEEECRWARLVATEFQAQVEREQAVNIPESSHMRCTGEQHLAKGQVGFFKFWVAPYFEELAEQIPELKARVHQIAENVKAFAEVANGSRTMVSYECACLLGVYDRCCPCLQEPATQRDNELMSWSVGVAKNALGDTHPAIIDAQPVRVLMNSDLTVEAEVGSPSLSPSRQRDGEGATTAQPPSHDEDKTIENNARP